MRLLSIIILPRTFMHLLRIHFSDHHSPILIAPSASFIIQGHYAIRGAVLADSQIRHNPMMIIAVDVPRDHFADPLELLGLHGRLISPWKPIMSFGASRAHLIPDKVTVNLLTLFSHSHH